MVKARKYVVKRHFEGMPTKADFEVVETELRPIKNGEILVKAEWMSVDPYFRLYNTSMTVPYDQFGHQVGLVLESKDPRFPQGSRVVSHKGWCDYAIIDANDNPTDLDRVYKLPDLKGLPASLATGAVGMPDSFFCRYGFGTLHSAWSDMLLPGFYFEICRPKAGETVVVTAAAGAVGSLVGQIAKIKGCKVIGFAGSDEKVKWLENDLGFDKAINYKTNDISKALKEAAPEGVDCYYDNIGGEITSEIIRQMNTGGRVAVVGGTSFYNNESNNPPMRSDVQTSIILSELKIEGFKIWAWGPVDWISSGKLVAREHVTEGFDKLVDAFINMLNGENFGKAVVKV